MDHIGGFFSKIAGAFAQANQKKEAVISVCKEQGIELKPEQIEFQGNSVRLSASPGAKSAVFLKKQKILEELNKKIRPAVSDIR